MTYSEKITKLNSLRDFINGDNQSDILLILDKEYKQDKFNIICAVMDWFNVVESYLDSSKILKESTLDYNWGNVYLYICAVDIVTKGINDLHKIIEKDDRHLFEGENEIFENSECDDNHHFQNIRAIFGAHPTDLKGNDPYIVATFPTPYDSSIDALRNDKKNWDYYTLLWSKEKNNTLEQKQFGFSFKSIDKYLDKYILYLEKFCESILSKIKEYKTEISAKTINEISDSKKQINLLSIKDKERLNGKYSYELEIIKKILNVKITDKENNKKYAKYVEVIEKEIPKLHEAIQNPIKYNNINFIYDIIDCEFKCYDRMYSYSYSKLMEYEKNEDMYNFLINYFMDKIPPFNNNISTLEELYCIVKASNYFNKNGISKK